MRQEEVVIAADTEPAAGAGLLDSERARAGEQPFQSAARRGTTARQEAAAPSGMGVPTEPLLPGAEEKRARRRDVEGGGSLVVPGLEVISISWFEEGALAGGVRVLQRLPGGDTLEVIHLPPDVEPGRLEPFADGKTGVLAVRGAGWVILRARLSVAELAELKARLDGAPGGK